MTVLGPLYDAVSLSKKTEGGSSGIVAGSTLNFALSDSKVKI